MSDYVQPVSELMRGDIIDAVFNDVCFGVPVIPETAEDVAAGIRCAMQLDARPLFLEGLAVRLTELGTACSVSDTEVMLTEIKRRYKENLGKPCPK